MAKEKKSGQMPGILLYFDDLEPAMQMFSNAELGVLIRAAVDYAQKGETPCFEETERAIGYAFATIKPSLDRNRKQYRIECLRNAYAGSRPKGAKDLTPEQIEEAKKAFLVNRLREPEYSDLALSDFGIIEAEVSEEGEEGDSDPENLELMTTEDEFEIFWNSYPELRRVRKPSTLKAFEKAREKAPLTEILFALEQYKKTSTKAQDGYSDLPTATKWLNREPWEDFR